MFPAQNSKMFLSGEFLKTLCSSTVVERSFSNVFHSNLLSSTFCSTFSPQRGGDRLAALRVRRACPHREGPRPKTGAFRLFFFSFKLMAFFFETLRHVALFWKQTNFDRVLRICSHFWIVFWWLLAVFFQSVFCLISNGLCSSRLDENWT